VAKLIVTGWRLDYTMVSAQFEDNIEEAGIYSNQLGSDHCPVYLKLKKQPDPPPHETPALSSKYMRKVSFIYKILSFLFARNKRALTLFL
jgi:hypothetical protein